MRPTDEDEEDATKTRKTNRTKTTHAGRRPTRRRISRTSTATTWRQRNVLPWCPEPWRRARFGVTTPFVLVRAIYRFGTEAELGGSCIPIFAACRPQPLPGIPGNPAEKHVRAQGSEQSEERDRSRAAMVLPASPGKPRPQPSAAAWRPRRSSAVPRRRPDAPAATGCPDRASVRAAAPAKAAGDRRLSAPAISRSRAAGRRFAGKRLLSHDETIGADFARGGRNVALDRLAGSQRVQGLRLELDDVLHSPFGQSLPTDLDAHDGRGNAEHERVHGFFPRAWHGRGRPCYADIIILPAMVCKHVGFCRDVGPGIRDVFATCQHTG